MGPLSRRRFRGEVQFERSRLAGTAGPQWDFLLGPSRGVKSPSRPGSVAPCCAPGPGKVDCSPAGVGRMLTLTVRMPTAAPLPPRAVWWHWVSLKPAQLRFIIPRPRWVWERRINWVAKILKSNELVKSRLSVSFCYQYLSIQFARSYKAHCRELLWIQMRLGAGGAHEEGNEDAGAKGAATSQCSKGPSFTVASKCWTLPRTSTVEKEKPVDIKFFREDFSFFYDLFSIIYFK